MSRRVNATFWKMGAIPSGRDECYHVAAERFGVYSGGSISLGRQACVWKSEIRELLPIGSFRCEVRESFGNPALKHRLFRRYHGNKSITSTSAKRVTTSQEVRFVTRASQEDREISSDTLPITIPTLGNQFRWKSWYMTPPR